MDVMMTSEERRDKQVARSAKYQKENKEKIKIRRKAHTAANKERLNAESSLWRKKNRLLANTMSKDWQQRNKPKVAKNSADRRAIKLNATPGWANKFFIEEIYSLAELRTRITGIKWEVDHTVPLRSRLVCGLHCESNMQLLPAKSNSAKGNRHWPGMP